jgi:hypothetical protein
MNLKQKTAKLNLDNLENARNIVTLLTIGSLVACSILLLILAFVFSDTEQTIKLTATPTSTPTPTSSPTPARSIVQYVIKFVGDGNLSSSVEFWYTSDVQGTNSKATVLLRNNVPHTVTLQLDESANLEISAILLTELQGELTCQIYEDGSLIVQNTNTAMRPGVYCRGVMMQ